MKQLIIKTWRNNNFLSLLGNLIFAAIGFLSFFLLARSYDLSNFGKYMLYISGGTFIEMFRFGLTRTSIVKFLSGATLQEQKAYIGSNWTIGLALTLAINILMWIALVSFPKTITSSGFNLFFLWYPFLSIVNLPLNNAISILQATEEFKKLLLIRGLSTIFFFLYLVINFWVLHCSIQTTIILHILSQLLVSLICIFLGWDGIKQLRHTEKPILLKLLHFGKYSIGTLLSSSLLKSADTFILGMVPFMGTTAVAIYSIPLKLTELLEIPLRSFAATVFPRMSKASAINDNAKVTGLFYDYSGMTTLLFIPFIIACWIFAPQMVQILGGGQYSEAALVFRIYILYGIFLPIDRFSGVALDSIGQPKYNLYKVLIMASINIIGDFIIIYTFRSLLGVASISILVTSLGAFMGYYFFSMHQKLNIKLIWLRGWKFLLTILKLTGREPV